MEQMYPQLPQQAEEQTQPEATVSDILSPRVGKSRKWIWLIGIVFLVIVIIVGGWKYLEYRKEVKEIEEDIVELIEPELAKPAVDPYPNDTDRDGLTNEEEEALGTSLTDFDTDGDGLSDRKEINVWKTDPLNTDTDGDGYGDGYEILKGYNPNGPGSL
jgi:hypothetical protein